MNDKKVLFLVWGSYYRRPTELAEAIGADLVYVKGLINSRGLLWKLFFWIDYIKKLLESFWVLISRRPRVVIAQSPPVMCPMAAYLYTSVARGRLFIDAHNSVFEKPWITFPGAKYLLRAADTVIIHNNELELALGQCYGNVNWRVEADVLPNFAVKAARQKNAEEHILVVCSWDADEPLEELFAAIKSYSDTQEAPIRFKVSGDHSKNARLHDEYSSCNCIEFMGFVSNEEFSDVLIHCAGVIALSTRENVQQCATIEAMSVSKPLLISDGPTSRRLFFKGAVMCDNQAESIKSGILDLVQNARTLSDGMAEVRNFWLEAETQRIARLKEDLTSPN